MRAELLVDVADELGPLLERCGTQRAKVSLRVGKGDHGIGTGFVLPVERGGLRWVEATRFCVIWIVEPESHVEGVCREQAWLRRRR